LLHRHSFTERTTERRGLVLARCGCGVRAWCREMGWRVDAFYEADATQIRLEPVATVAEMREQP
jgi:hypothetical protein